MIAAAGGDPGPGVKGMENVVGVDGGEEDVQLQLQLRPIAEMERTEVVMS